jgi:hypothetical protein
VAVILLAGAWQAAPAGELLPAQLGARAFDWVLPEAPEPSAMRGVQHFGGRLVELGYVRRRPTAACCLFEEAQRQLEPVLAHLVRIAPSRRASDANRAGRHEPAPMARQLNAIRLCTHGTLTQGRRRSHNRPRERRSLRCLVATDLRAHHGAMADLSHRGFLVSVFVRRTRGMWEVMTTIYVPDGLAHELGDQVIMDVDQSPTNRIEYVRSEAFEKAKKVIDDLVVSRAVMPLPTN